MSTDYKTSIGFDPDPASAAETRERLLEYVNIKLAARGCPVFSKQTFPFLEMGKALLANMEEKNRLLSDHLCPADQHIQQFLDAYLAEVKEDETPCWVPTVSLSLERHGLARMLSLPPDEDSFKSDIISSYRVQQGICNNPAKDRRTTKGVFHICEGGFVVPADKREVPKRTYARLLKHALNPPRELLRLPFTSTQEEQAEIFCSLLLRPIVCPEVPGYIDQKSIEVRFFAPGNLVSNLDFVESIFGNAGDPFLAQNDARLDTRHWSGHTGCVILAPHLVTLKKKDLGLPHIDDATDRQKKDGMCWASEDELYNDGGAFKVTCRDHRGVMVTLIADNYFGYCKKEVKTMLSYAANLYGLCEEEHAGGALAFPCFDLGEDFHLSRFHPEVDHRWSEVVEQYAPLMDQREGYAVDKTWPDIYYIAEDAAINLRKQAITWNGTELKLQPGITYVLPSGYKVEMVKYEGRWRLIGTTAEGTFCHKPCTVSGGGKSEISKPITDAMFTGPVITKDFKRDIEHAEEIIGRDFGDRYERPLDPNAVSRPLLSSERSLGSVVKLLTPNTEYTADYNKWLGGIPRHIRDLVLLIKRFYKPAWGDDWRSWFSVDSINGQPGYEIKYRKQKILSTYLRIGFTEDGAWRTFGLRKDFSAAVKLQTEDDISASIVVPAGALHGLHPELDQFAYKFALNCEYRLFQRPDEAIIRGYDKTAERDFSKGGNFFSNYEPIPRAGARAMVEDTILFDQFSEPIQRVIREFVAADSPEYCMSTSHPRIVDGEPSKNPRYLQNRPDLEDPRAGYLAEIGARLHRRIPLGEAVHFPVNAVLPGRRNNPPDHEKGIRPLAVYNPIHYQELPELFMEFIPSLTGKSPSTTGAGSEGAMTKGPFNALPQIIDLNNALVSYLLTGQGAFVSSAGYIGPKYRVDHDISLLIPEVWSRMYVREREPAYLIENGYLEKVDDFEHQGQTVMAGRLGYRITDKFTSTFFGRMFSDPGSVFDEEMLKPEIQNLDDYVDGILNITETQERIARLYFEDGTIELACPPLKALIHIMAHGDFEGKDANHPEVRALFTREALLASDWYQARLAAREETDRRHWSATAAYLEAFLGKDIYREEAERLHIADRLEAARKRLGEIGSAAYREGLNGTLGTDPAVLQA